MNLQEKRDFQAAWNIGTCLQTIKDHRLAQQTPVQRRSNRHRHYSSTSL